MKVHIGIDAKAAKGKRQILLDGTASHKAPETELQEILKEAKLG